MKKYYVHIDGDAFFVACEVARRPELLGKCVVVGEERGMVTALSYEAKRAGIKRGDPIFKIKKDYKDVIILQSHFELYEKYSRMLYKILMEYTDSVEAYSVDECFMSFEYEYFMNVNIQEFFINLKRRIKIELGINYSFGVSYSKVTAKLASKHMKPDGLCVILDKSKLENIYKLKNVSEVWGIGQSSVAKLASVNINTIYDFINTSVYFLNNNFNKNILELYHELKWENRLSIVKNHKTLKSLQATRSFQESSHDRNYIFSELSRNIEQACSRLHGLGLFTNSLIIFIKKHIRGGAHGEIVSLRIELENYTSDPVLILRKANLALDSIYLSDTLYKATGVSMLNLRGSNNIESSLFDLIHNQDQDEIKCNNLSDLISLVNKKSGKSQLHIASSLQSRTKRHKQLEIRNQNDSYYYDLPLPYMGVAFCN
jgi:nucleotidyltransferase/DNA polymerase involved in DNA repair